MKQSNTIFSAISRLISLGFGLYKSKKKQLVHYTEDQYAKRLVGNAFSVPALEMLLKPLQKMFTSASYGPHFNYNYEWEKKGKSSSQ